MAWVRQKLPRVKKNILRVGSGTPKNYLGWVGQNTLGAGQISGRVLTRPDPSLNCSAPKKPNYNIHICIENILAFSLDIRSILYIGGRKKYFKMHHEDH